MTILVASLCSCKELRNICLKNMAFQKKYLWNFSDLDLKIFYLISTEDFNLLNSAFDFTVFLNK